VKEYYYPPHESREWSGKEMATSAPRAKINRRFPAQYEDLEEGVRKENLEQDPEAQRIIKDKRKLDEERRRRKCISNKKYRDKVKQEKKEKREAEEQQKRKEEKLYMNWLEEEKAKESEEEDNNEVENQELTDPPSYVMESGYKQNPMMVPNDYEPGEQGVCVICGTSGLVDTECEKFSEATLIYSPTNYPVDTEHYVIPPIKLSGHSTVNDDPRSYESEY
jgi:hypothetical protein